MSFVFGLRRSEFKLQHKQMGGKPDIQSRSEGRRKEEKKKHQKMRAVLCWSQERKGTTIWNFHLLQRNSRVIFHLEWMVFKWKCEGKNCNVLGALSLLAIVVLHAWAVGLLFACVYERTNPFLKHHRTKRRKILDLICIKCLGSGHAISFFAPEHI